MRKRIGGTVRVNKPVVEQATFDNQGTWEAYYAAQAWAKAKGFTAGSTCAMLPLALVKGDYDATPLPWKWKNFRKGDEQYVDGTITGDFREGPVTVRLFVS